MITPAFLAFVAVTALSDFIGPGHQWRGLALLTVWYFMCRLFGPHTWRCLLTAAMVISIAISALAVAQMFVMPRARGPFASPNFLGAYAVLMFFLTAARVPSPKVWLRRIAAAANLLSLALSQSRGAFLALGAGLTVMLWRRFGWLPLMAAGMAVVLIRPGVSEARWEIWRLAWMGAMQRPLTGWGQGGLVIGGLDRFYSIPLEVFAASGLGGVAAGAWLLYAATRAVWTSPTLLAFLAAWFAQGLFLFSIPATNILLVTVLAALSLELHADRESSSAHVLLREPRTPRCVPRDPGVPYGRSRSSPRSHRSG